MKLFYIRKTFIFITIFLLASCAPQATPQPTEPTAQPFPQVSIPNSEVRQLSSPETGRDYDIYVRLPDDYEQHPGQKYPVLYLLDGQWDFKMLDSIYGGLEYDGFVPEMIIAGITYSGEGVDYNALRAMDYTPVEVSYEKGSGDAPGFYAFIKERLIPFIESEYRADPARRVLMGSSYGGAFTLYALFSDPSLFYGYVASSPIVVYGGNFAYRQEAEYFARHKDLPVRLFVGVGGDEDVRPPVEDFTRRLRERGYEGLEMDMRVIEGEGHASNKPETFNRGLRFIFQ